MAVGGEETKQSRCKHCTRSPPSIPIRSTLTVNTKLCVFKNAKSEELSLKPDFGSGNLCNLGKIESVSEHCGSDLFLKCNG